MTGNRATLLFLALIAVVSAGALVAVSVTADDADAANADTTLDCTLSYYNKYSASNWPDNQAQEIPGTATAVTWKLSDKVPVRDGYTFVHWDVGVLKQDIKHYGYCDPGATITIDVRDRDGLRVIAEAVWSANIDCTLSYYNKYSASNWPDNQAQEIPGTATAVTWKLSDKVPVRDGYTFVHWDVGVLKQDIKHYGYCDPGATITIDVRDRDGLRVIAEAVWSAPVTLSFDANGGAGAPASVTQTVIFDGNSAPITLPSTTPTRDGYQFSGWALDASATSPSFRPGETVSVTATANQTVTLYAVWSQIHIDGYGVRVSYDTIEMVPSGNTDATYWSNGYQNTSVSMLVQRPAQSTTMPVTAVYTDGTKSSAYNVSYDGAWSVNGVVVGDWPGIVLTMSVSGVSVRPVSSMVSMADYAVVDSDVIIDPGASQRIRYLEISGLDGGQALKVQIVGTVIYADASSAYVSDGTFSPATKYPDADNIMLVYNTPVHPGDAIAIKLSSGQSYRWEVSGSGVTIDGAVYPIQGVTLVWAAASLGTVTIAGQTYDAGHLYYRTAPAAPLIDLGETTNAFTVTDEGVWIASVDYYAGVSKTSTAVHWGGSYWSLDWNTALALLAGFTLMAFLAIRVGTNRTVTWIDFAVLGVGAIIILILMEP